MTSKWSAFPFKCVKFERGHSLVSGPSFPSKGDRSSLNASLGIGAKFSKDNICVCLLGLESSMVLIYNFPQLKKKRQKVSDDAQEEKSLFRQMRNRNGTFFYPQFDCQPLSHSSLTCLVLLWKFYLRVFSSFQCKPQQNQISNLGDSCLQGSQTNSCQSSTFQPREKMTSASVNRPNG